MAGLRGARLAVAVGVVAGLCFFIFGYDQGDLGGLLVVPAFRRRFPQLDTISRPDSLHVATVQGIAVAAWNIGCFVSAMLTIFWGDLIGRKKTIYLGLTVLIIGEIIQCTAFSFAQLVVGRVIAGVGNGFNTATVPAWQAECTKAHRRGTLLMISAGACISAGLSFSYWIDFALAWDHSNSASWRVPIAIQLPFALITLALLTICPESPRWLILSGREQQALEVLAQLNDLEPADNEIHQEFLQIKDAVIEMAKGSVSDLFSMGEYRHLHRVVLAYLLQVFQQMSGINLILQYLGLMFVQQWGYKPWVAMLIAACAGSEYFLASFVAVVGIDRFWGRRSLMMFGAVGMCACMIVLSIMAYLNSHASRIVGTVFVFGFNSFFAIGWQGMAWLYQVEIIPLRIRGPANALSTSANWLLNFVVVLIAPVAFHNIGYRTYIIFAATNAILMPIIYYLFPETGFRSLEEVDVIFYAASLTPNPWLSVRRIAANEPLWYGKDGEESFDYEDSDWHRKHVRFSDEIKDSDGCSHKLNDHSDSSVSNNHYDIGRAVSSDESYPNEKSDSPSDSDDAAPSPNVPRTNHGEAELRNTLRSAGRG